MSLKKLGYVFFVLALGSFASCSSSHSLNDITAFSIDGTIGAINEVALPNPAITVTMPSGTAVTNLTPTITVSEGCSVSPASGVAQDFTNPVTYTVTAADATTRTYTATVTLLAPGAVALGSVGAFGIMATSAITDTGSSVINGDVSLEPGSSCGLLPAQVNGVIHVNDTVSHQARADLLVAYNFATNLAPGTTISGGADLGALYPGGIPAGTYTSGSTMLVSTPLVLDGGGNANAVWVFQIGSSLTTAANITLANGAQAKNVFWVPVEDATIGVGTTFTGTIVSGRDVTCVTGSTINGRILAGATTDGTVALQGCTVTVPTP
jgi:hypothetical protein